LPSYDPIVRLSGMFALGRVINNSPEYSKIAFETLTVYVRDSTKAATDDGPPFAEIQVALTVIVELTPLNRTRDGLGNNVLAR
jgi:hypothetical protein